MRYEVCVFPSPDGSPWRTDWWWAACAFFAARRFIEVREVRLIDRLTGEHYVA